MFIIHMYMSRCQHIEFDLMMKTKNSVVKGC